MGWDEKVVKEKWKKRTEMEREERGEGNSGECYLMRSNFGEGVSFFPVASESIHPARSQNQVTKCAWMCGCLSECTDESISYYRDWCSYSCTRYSV